MIAAWMLDAAACTALLAAAAALLEAARLQARSAVSPTEPLRTIDSMTVTPEASGLRVHVGAVRRPAKQGVPSALTSVDPAHIRSIDVRKLRPGQIVPDSLSVVWIQLRAPGELAASRTRTTGTTEPIGLRRTRHAPGTPEPLYLIDGRELPADQVEASMKALDPADIETIEVQKTETAVARYGDRARGGVILITTKRR